jgi:hypothetical protein
VVGVELDCVRDCELKEGSGVQNCAVEGDDNVGGVAGQQVKNEFRIQCLQGTPTIVIIVRTSL